MSPKDTKFGIYQKNYNNKNFKLQHKKLDLILKMLLD